MEAGGWASHSRTQKYSGSVFCGDSRDRILDSNTDLLINYHFTLPNSKTRKLGVCPQTHSLTLMSQTTIKDHIQLKGSWANRLYKANVVRDEQGVGNGKDTLGEVFSGAGAGARGGKWSGTFCQRANESLAHPEMGREQECWLVKKCFLDGRFVATSGTRPVPPPEVPGACQEGCHSLTRPSRTI